MKRFFVVFVLLAIIFQLHSADNADLTIKAFKSSYDGVRVIINDRITREDIFILNNSAEGTSSATGSRMIELNNVIHELLGYVSDTSTQSAPSALDSYVVFSYRVEGNATGSYSLQFVLNNLRNSSNSDEYINTSYQLGNFDVVFPTSAESGEPSDNFNSDNSIAIMYDNTNIQEGSAVGEKGVTTLESSWKIGTPTIQSGSLTGVVAGANEPCSTWIARGAVGMTIDSTGYSNASNGEYIAEVVVMLICP